MALEYNQSRCHKLLLDFMMRGRQNLQIYRMVEDGFSYYQDILLIVTASILMFIRDSVLCLWSSNHFVIYLPFLFAPSAVVYSSYIRLFTGWCHFSLPIKPGIIAIMTTTIAVIVTMIAIKRKNDKLCK